MIHKRLTCQQYNLCSQWMMSPKLSSSSYLYYSALHKFQTYSRPCGSDLIPSLVHNFVFYTYRGIYLSELINGNIYNAWETLASNKNSQLCWTSKKLQLLPDKEREKISTKSIVRNCKTVPFIMNLILQFRTFFLHDYKIPIIFVYQIIPLDALMRYATSSFCNYSV